MLTWNIGPKTETLMSAVLHWKFARLQTWNLKANYLAFTLLLWVDYLRTKYPVLALLNRILIDSLAIMLLMCFFNISMTVQVASWDILISDCIKFKFYSFYRLVMWRFRWKCTPPNSSWLRLKVKTSQLTPVFVWVNSGILICDSFIKAKKVPSFQVRIKSLRSTLCVGSTSYTRSHQKCVYRNVS